VKLVLYDERAGSPANGELMELSVGAGNYVLVQIPPDVWNGVKGLGQTPSIVAYCATLPHDPGEIDRLDPFSDRIPYDWALRHG
jgi:dTDP-4-dehydrorhamnose 3,5-epimerase